MVSCGIPQGSVLSPFLVLIYANDVAQASYFHTTLFANDIHLHMSNSCFNVLQTIVNLELCVIDPGFQPTNFLLITIRLTLCY